MRLQMWEAMLPGFCVSGPPLANSVTLGKRYGAFCTSVSPIYKAGQLPFLLHRFVMKNK